MQCLKVNKKKYFFIGLLLFFNLVSYGQMDKEFWFVAPAISEDHSAEDTCGCNGPNSKCGAAPVSLNFTNANETEAASIIIRQPANEYDAILNPLGFRPIFITVPPNSFHREELWGNYLCDTNVQIIRQQIENRLDPLVPSTPLDKGLHITSTEYITVYYEVEEQNNSDIYALKGANALGDVFYCNFQTNNTNHLISNQIAYAAIDFVAVDPGTTRIWVYPTNPIIGWGQPDSFYVDLTQGQTVSLVPGVDNGGGSYTYNRNPVDQLHGTKIRVEDGKRIAVTLSDDSVDGDTGCFDLLGDQTVPVQALGASGERSDLIGTEYIVMKGYLGAGNNDRIYILATEDGTNVEVTDVTNSITYNYNNLAEGQQQVHTIADTGNITYVTSDDVNKPIYVLHVTGAGNGCELGQAVLPTVSLCTGSFNVGFSRGSEENKDFLLNVMVREENDNDSARYAFKFNGKPIPGIGDDFVKIPGAKWWAAQLNFDDSVTQYTKNIISNTKNIFHLGTLNGGSINGGNYGYFSNYAAIKARSYVSGIGEPGIKLCWGESARLVAEGGLTYEWIPDTFLSDAFVQKPYCTPLTNIKYNVVVRGATCALADTAQIEVLISDSLSADFDLDNPFGCAPLQVNAVNQSYNAQDNFWYLDGSYYYYGVNPPTFNFTNSTDTSVDHTIKLVTRESGGCVKTYSRIIRVYPEIDAAFSVDTIAGCHPLTISFSDSSSGFIDTTGYYWDFGDLTQSSDVNPVHTFKNINSNDQTFKVKLKTVSPFLCEDSAEVNILVHPIIEAKLAIDTAIGCSPFQATLNPVNSIGVDTFYYHISKRYENQLIKMNSYATVQVNHTDTSQASPDTIDINMIAMNRMGCTDTLDERKLIVYPIVNAAMQPDTTAICDSLEVLFTNQSTGYDLSYEWFFGDGTNFTDTSGQDYTHTYLNRGTNTDTSFVVTLKATSNFLCSDTYNETIIVHPYVNAAFNLELDGHCTPLDVTLKNISEGLNTYDLFWGSDTTFFNIPGLVQRSHRFENTGTTNDTIYQVKLIARHQVGGCSDSMVKPVTVFPEVVADFSLSDTEGCQPLVTAINNQSRGNNLIYSWDFGDESGADTSALTFSKTFNNYSAHDTTYNIDLYVTNGLGCDSSITRQINVYAYVKADFGVETIDTCSPFPIQIKNLSSPGVTGFEWDFDDGGLSSNQFEPSHQYINQTDSIEHHFVQLVALNQHPACADTAIKRITVYPEMFSSFTLDKQSGCPPLLVNFTNNSNFIAGTDFSWDFGDTTFYYGEQPPSHLFYNWLGTPVDREVTVRAVSPYYCYDDTTITVNLFPRIEARFAIEQPEICSGDSFKIDPSASLGYINEYFWNTDVIPGAEFSKASNLPFNFTFENKGELTDDKLIELVVENSYNCTDTATENILVRPSVIADFNVEPNTGCYPFTAVINNRTPKGAHQAQIFDWTLGDGSTSNDTSRLFSHFYQNLSHTSDSVFVISLYAKSIYNCADIASDTILVHPKPAASFSVQQAIGCPPFTPVFLNKSNGTDLSYDWTFPNGLPQQSTDRTPEVSFLNATNGIITNRVVLRVETEHGCADTVAGNIRVYPGVNANIEVAEDTSCHPMIADFSNSVAENAFTYEWTVDGETFSIEENPSDIYFGNETDSDKELHIVLYGESANGCKDSDMINVTIFPKPDVDYVPQPLSQYYDVSDDATSFDFRNITNYRPSWAYTWDFGDGLNGDDTSYIVTHTYGNEFWGDLDNDNKVYTSLLAINPEHPQCKDFVEHYIVINPPEPVIDIGEAVDVCGEDTLYLTALYRYVYNDSFKWDFGDGRTSNESEPEFIIYNQPGDYIIKLEVSGDGGSAWDFKHVTVHEKPLVDFTFYPDLATAKGQHEIPDTIYFNNLTKFAQVYEWKFYPEYEGMLQQPSIDSVEHPKRTFELFMVDGDSTYYTIQLKAVNVVSPELMCIDSIIRYNTFKVVPGGVFDLPNAIDLGSDEEQINTFLPYLQNWISFDLEIYDRWGTLLFETDDPEVGWDGRIQSSGKYVKPGVYVYRVKATFTNGRKVVKTGDITVLKTR